MNIMLLKNAVLATVLSLYKLVFASLNNDDRHNLYAS
jgi:hypothetical protein